ncbi:MAG: DUF262 domain-containing protein [Pyrinomonadaceae bacterium]
MIARDHPARARILAPFSRFNSFRRRVPEEFILGMGTINYTSDQKTILDLQNMYENGQLNLNPGFQRSSVWTERDRAKLINSILRNYPLPSIFLYCRNKDGNIVYDVAFCTRRLNLNGQGAQSGCMGSPGELFKWCR